MAGKKEVKPATAIAVIVVVIVLIAGICIGLSKRPNKETSPQTNTPKAEDMMGKMKGTIQPGGGTK